MFASKNANSRTRLAAAAGSLSKKKKRKWHIHTKGNAINLDNEAPGTDIHIITFINAILVHKMDPRYMEV
jgi:hypothetical protein